MEYGPSKISGVLVFALAVSGVIASMHWLRAEPQTQEAAKKIEQAIEKETAEVRLRTMEVKTGQDSPGVSVNLGAANVVHRTAIE